LPRGRIWNTCNAHIDSYLTLIRSPGLQRMPTMLLIPQVLGRAMLTSREATTLQGLMRQIRV